MIKLKIPATSANMGAGFDSIGVALNLYNEVFFEPADKTTVISLDGVQIPIGDDNLIVSSAKKLYEICGFKLKGGFCIKQINRIPLTRGLGSSSACIIAGLEGANYFLKNPLSKSELLDLAVKMEGHPDNVAPALLGGVVVSAFDGEKVYWAKYEIDKNLLFYAIVPNFSLSTEKAREILPKAISYSDAIFNLSRAALFIASLLQGKYENLKTATDDSLHQPYRFPLIKGAENIKKLCYDLGGHAFYLSGAGSTLMAIGEKGNDSFPSHLKNGLEEIGCGNYNLLELCVDNDGVKLYEETEGNSKE